MEILQLRYFFESANNENFAKTAEKYMVPTSSVSASVRRLEQELDCKLFDRTGNRIALNQNGRKLQQTLCSVFSQLDRTVEDLTGMNTDDGEIKMLVRAMRSSITDSIITYKKKYPHITFKTVFDFGETNFEKYDVIIDEKKDSYPDYESFDLCTLRIRLMVSADSPLLGRKLTMKQLYNQPFVSLSEQSNMHKLLMRACKQAGFSPNIAITLNDLECHKKMIASGMGIGLGREALRQAGDAIDYLQVADFDERYTVYGYFKKESACKAVRHFLEFLKKQAF